MPRYTEAKNLVVKWITKTGVKDLQQFEKFFTNEFYTSIMNELNAEVARLTFETYGDLRKLWSGKLLDVRTGRMLGSLRIDIKKGKRYFVGRIWSMRRAFDDRGYYYPLTHEAFNRPNTIIRPKRAKYLTIPPYPPKGFHHWTKTKQVTVPKRPAFQIVVEDLRENKIPKRLKKTKEIAIKLFGRGGK